MADLAPVAANVTKSAGTSFNRAHDAGEDLAVFEAVYTKEVTVGGKTVTRWFRAQADGTAAEAAATGIAMHAALTGQPLAVAQTGTDLNVGSILTAGEVYVLSANAGKVAPLADLVAGNYVTILGYGKSASVFAVQITSTGVAHG